MRSHQLADKIVRAERATRAFGGRQLGKGNLAGFQSDQIDEAAYPLDQQRDAHQAVVPAGEMRAGARPLPASTTPNPAPTRRVRTITNPITAKSNEMETGQYPRGRYWPDRPLAESNPGHWKKIA